MQITKQLALFLENRPGVLARVCDALSEAKINIYAVSSSDTVDHIVVQNRTQLDTCRANYCREATLIPSCYELPDKSREGKDSAEKKLILWCGTVHTYKRPEILLELARRLAQHV